MNLSLIFGMKVGDFFAFVSGCHTYSITTQAAVRFLDDYSFVIMYVTT